MLTAFVLTLREAVEAILIIGILLSLVNKTRPKHGAAMIYGGAAAAIMVSAAVARIFGEAYRAFGTSVEGISGILAVAL